MEKLIYKLKSAKITKSFIFKAFLCIFLLIFYIFVYVNQFDLIFFANGFNSVLDCKMQIYMLDVGQATSCCVVTPEREIWVLDTGSQSSSSTFMSQIDMILRKNNLHKIDYLLLSHSDEDHVGGAISLLAQKQVCHVLRPKIYAKSEEKIEDWRAKEDSLVYDLVIKAVYAEPNCEVKATEDDILVFDDFLVSIFATENTTRQETNSYSPFVLFYYSNKSFLFTGDATQTRENEFLKDLGTTKISVDILQVAHHGSNSSSSQKFLDAISPKVALVSAGDKSYPHNDVVNRLRAAGIKEIYATYDVGMLGFGLGNVQTISFATTKGGLDLPLFVVVMSIFAFVILGFDFSNKNQKFYNLFLLRKNIP